MARPQCGVLDVPVVLIPEGYASEAIAPAEIGALSGSKPVATTRSDWRVL
jgi:hypothetical protein